MDNTEVTVFLGDTVEDDAERHVLERLRRDLAQRSIPAVIYANFFARGKKLRQVDLLVVTPSRCVQVELKNLDVTKPLIGHVNGPWLQQLAPGQTRTLDRNYFVQALEATYAVSDVMRRVARRGEAPKDGPFPKHIETVLCIYPHVPVGSDIDRNDRVKVLSYDALLDRLGAPGPRPPWDDSHWEAFTRELGVFTDQPESEAEQTRRVSTEVVAEYAARLTSALGRDLPALVPIGALVGDEAADAALPPTLAAVRLGRAVTLIGQSGTGKSHTARHAALRLASEGHMPVWLRCREYTEGRFRDLLKRATAPFSTLKPWNLLRSALDAGAMPVLILDGFNECEPALQAELLGQVEALRLRMPTGVIVTSTTPAPALEPEHVQVTVQVPDEQERAAVMAAYAVPAVLVPAAFRTPYELALAASCAEELEPTASKTDLFDTFVRRQAGTAAVRSALRALALEMDRQLRSSLTIAEATQRLERGQRPLAGEDIDGVLASPLLEVRQGRLSFTHEQIARFLTADKLVNEAPDVPTLVQWLTDPRHGDLRATVVGLERDEDRAHELLLALADDALLTAALKGAFGARLADRVYADVSATLAEARADSQKSTFSPHPEAPGFGSWQSSSPRSAGEVALLALAGVALRGGLFVPDVVALLDETDERCAAEMRRLQESGHAAAITEVVSATYAGWWSDSKSANCLPASIVLHAVQSDFRRLSEGAPERSLPTELMATSPQPARWGRLYAALHLTNAANDKDAELLPHLLREAWKANGYHLRLEALTTVSRCGRVVPAHVRAELAEILSALEPPSHLGLSSTLVEALAACDAIEPINSLEDIREQIAAVVAAPEDPDAWAAARGIVFAQFDPEDIVGPFAEAVSELSDADSLRLHTMAARDEGMSFNREWVLREVADRAAGADVAAVAVLREAAATVPTGWQPQEAVQAHLEGLRGWAVVSDALPVAAPAASIVARAWRLVDHLVFAILRDDEADAPPAPLEWDELLDLCAPATVDVLYWLSSADARWYRRSNPGVYEELVERYPKQVRQLMEWGLSNRDSLVSQFEHVDVQGRARYMIEVLAAVGDARTRSLLQHYVLDPDLGPAAVEAIRKLERHERQ